jgi:hypothetical protein
LGISLDTLFSARTFLCLWSNRSTCSARNPVCSSLCVPAVDLFFLLFFLFAISLYQIHRARLVPRSFRLTSHELYVIPVLKQITFHCRCRTS